MPSSRCRRATFSRSGAEVRLGRRHALELDERAEPVDRVEVDAHAVPQQQVALLVDHHERAERGVERGAQVVGVLDRA